MAEKAENNSGYKIKLGFAVAYITPVFNILIISVKQS
jgi:hypothetical protein